MKVIVCGAAGKMGREVIKAVTNQEGMDVVAGVDLLNEKSIDGIPIYSNVNEAYSEVGADAVVDFTNPNVVKENLDTYINLGLRAVIGTTGLSEEELVPYQEKVQDKDWAAIIAPNFAIGAILMMNFAVEAAKFFPNVEIIEYHHNQKKDAPSGTAIKTAEMLKNNIAKDKKVDYDEVEKLSGARGAELDEINIHSVRLPGYVAHQEVIFSLPGQNLTIRHDSTHRESFMPGVIMALSKIDKLNGIIYGLEHILFS